MSIERSPGSGTIGRASILGALVTVVAGSLCCVVPFVLVSAGITGSWLGALQIFEPYRLALNVAAVASLIVGWSVYVWNRKACTTAGRCASSARSRRTEIGLTLASVLVALLIAAPYLIAYFGG